MASNFGRTNNENTSCSPAELYDRIWSGGMPGYRSGKYRDREVIFYLRPYSNDLLKRTIKTPKMYFFDTGLVAYLTKYSSPEILMNGAINGAILENYVVSELRKTWLNDARECLLHYYRDKDKKEIDLVIEQDGELHPLEVKKSTNPGTELSSVFGVLDKGTVPRGAGAILCLKETMSAIDRTTYILPVWMI